MKKTTTIIFSCIILIACGPNQQSAQNINQTQAKNDPSVSKTTGQTTVNINPNKAEQLIGIWILKGADNPTLEITKFKVNHIEHLTSYKYKVVADSIRMQEDDYDEDYSYRQAFTFKGNDTLILSGDDGKEVFIRVKK